MTAAKREAIGARIPISPTMMLILQGRALEARVEAELRASGLSLRKMGLLGHLRRSPGLSFSELARRAGIRVQSLQPIVEVLIRDGLVRTVGGSSQGRAAVIELTANGLSELEAATTRIASIDREVFAEAEWGAVGESLVALGETLQRPPAGGSPVE